METQRTCLVCGAGLLTVDLVGAGFEAFGIIRKRGIYVGCDEGARY
jgi:hypothetical protein